LIFSWLFSSSLFFFWESSVDRTVEIISCFQKTTSAKESFCELLTIKLVLGETTFFYSEISKYSNEISTSAGLE
jgi:hypothetical protein